MVNQDQDQDLEAIINLSQLNSISQGDITFEVEILHVYVEDISKRLEQVRKVSNVNDWAKVMAVAHHIKGASANVGASQINLLAVRLEELNHDQEQAFKIIDQILIQIAAVELFVAEKLLPLLSTQEF